MGKFDYLRMSCSYNWSWIFSLQWVCVFSFLSFSFPFRFASPFLWRSLPYIVPSITSQPSICTILGNPLDACPIKTILEMVEGAVNHENIIQVSFLHKCGQFSWCSALNMEVAVTFPNISFFCCLHGFVAFPQLPCVNGIDTFIPCINYL